MKNLTQALRECGEHVPAGTFYAPDKYSVRKDNHNRNGNRSQDGTEMGYHVHVYSRGEEMPFVVTHDGKNFYVYLHGDDKENYSIKQAEAFVKNTDLLRMIYQAIGKKPFQEMNPVPKDAISFAEVRRY